MAAENDMRKLSDLRVVDLKNELEKRSLETTGIKSVLFERLSKALEDEGHDPQEYIFETCKSTPQKKNIKETNDKENISATQQSAENDKDKMLENAVPENSETFKVSTEGLTDTKYSKNDTVDHEDSLNLTIGEEDEKLFNEDISETKSKETDAEENLSKSIETSSQKDVFKPITEVTQPIDEKIRDSAIDTDESAENATKPSASKSGSSSQGRNLWVSGLSHQTRATDLKQLFSKFGKVVGAKVVTNTRTPGTRCYGYVTMASVKDATECIENLHRTELHGRLISVERAKSDLGPPKVNLSAASEEKRTKNDSSSLKKFDRNSTKDISEAKTKLKNDDKIPTKMKKEDETKNTEKVLLKEVLTEKTGSKDSRDSKESHHKHKSSSVKKDDHRALSSVKYRRDNEKKNSRRSKSRSNEILSFEKIREERERQRLRQKERELREEERRRREIARRQRDEENRLAREREKLALERARIEKEKVELLRLERERQKIEREKIELERLELKRQQRKIEEAKRAIKRPSDDRYDSDRKRPSERDRRFEAPPPPRFDGAISLNKREDFSSIRDDYHRDGPKGNTTYDRNTTVYKEDRTNRSESIKTRYDNYDRTNSAVWSQSQQGSSFNNASGHMFDANWRGIESGHDRYDRYNSERKIPNQNNSYVETPRHQFSGSTQERFASTIGRPYENRRF